MNKSLFRAAAIINIAAASLLYVACSGEDGANGRDGTSCVAQPSVAVPGGFDLICGGVPAGTLHPGAPGAPGPGGAEDGCYLTPAASGYDVVCAGATVGNIPASNTSGGCSIETTQGNPYFNFVCPGGVTYTLAKAICNYTGGSAPYDPDVKLCNTTSGLQSSCDGSPIALKNQFCAKATEAALTRTAFSRCGSKYADDYDPAADTDDSPVFAEGRSGEYNPLTHFCQNVGTPDGTNAIFPNVNANLILASGEVTPLCGTENLGGKFTKFDFCSGGVVYPRCGSNVVDTYLPGSQFCQPAGGAAVDVLPATHTATAVANAHASSTIENLCGTNSNGGRYTSNSFCSSAKVYPKCGSAPSVTSPTLPLGEYEVAKEYCYVNKVDDGSSTGNVTYTKAVGALALCGGVNNLNTTTHACVSGVPHPICEGKTPTDVTPTGSTYNVLKQFCDTRGSAIAAPTTANTSTPATTPVTATGGKLYDYASLGSAGVWMAQDLGEGVTAANIVSPGTDGISLNESSNPNWDGTNNVSVFNWTKVNSTSTLLCPEGWKVPSDSNWNNLRIYAGSAPGQELRVTSIDPSTGSSWSPPVWLQYSSGQAPNSSVPASLFAAKSREVNNPISTITSTVNISAGVTSDATKIGALTDAAPASTAPGNTLINFWWSSEGAADINLGNAVYIKDNYITFNDDTYNKVSTFLSVRCVK